MVSFFIESHCRLVRNQTIFPAMDKKRRATLDLTQSGGTPMPSPFELQPLTFGCGWCRWHRADTQTGNTFELIETMSRKYLNSIWVCFLDELGDGTMRLLSWRWCDYRGLGNTLSSGPCFMEPFSFMMSRKGLLVINQRVEAAAK